jgi:hypothetical protein
MRKKDRAMKRQRRKRENNKRNYARREAVTGPERAMSGPGKGDKSEKRQRRDEMMDREATQEPAGEGPIWMGPICNNEWEMMTGYWWLDGT